MFGFFIGVIVFIYLVGRIGRLEEQGRKLRGELTSVISFLESASPDDNKFIKENRQKDLRILKGENTAEEGFVSPNANSPVVTSPLTVDSISDIAHSVAHSIPESVVNPATASTSATITSIKVDNQDTEFAIGSKLITSVGLVAVFLGVVFFLRYAFENNLISPSMRVFLGVVFGIVFISIGHFLKEKYDTYATGLMGGGLGIFYISTYAAYSFYGLISEPVAFLYFICITGLGVILALLYSSKPLIQFSLLGGFIVPLIFPLAHSVHAIFPYLIILNLSILLIARFKVWPDLTVLGLVSTALLCMQWTVSNRAETALIETFSYLTILFGIYFTTSFINFIVRDRDYKGVDAFLLYALPMMFFVWCTPLIDTKEGFAILTFALALFYLVASVSLRVIFMSFPSIKLASNVMIMIGSSFLAAATALHFDGSTVTIFWALEAILMVSIGYMLNARENRVVGTVLAVIVGLKAILVDFDISDTAVALFNSRALTVLFVSVMFAVLWAVYKLIADQRIEIDERKSGSMIGAIGLSLLPFIWLNAEVLHFASGDAFRFLPIAWSLYALLFASTSFLVGEVVFRVFSHIILIGSICILIVTQWNLPVDQYVLLFNIRLLSAVVITVVLSAVATMIHKHRQQLIVDEQSLLMLYYIGINATLLWALSLEVTDYYAADESSKRVGLSVLWLGYACIALVVGIIDKLRFVRQFAISLLGITVFKIFIYDTASLSDVYRFVSFITLGVILLLVGFAYYRFKDRIVELVGVEDKKE